MAEKDRFGAERGEAPTKKPGGKSPTTYTNLITQLIMLFGSALIWWNYSESEVGAAVSMVLALFAGGMAFRDKAKQGFKFGWLAWLKSPNTFTRIGIILVGLAPWLPSNFSDLLRDLVKGLTEQNWQLVFTTALPLLSILFTVIRDRLVKT